jgi:hypothetical protein
MSDLTVTTEPQFQGLYDLNLQNTEDLFVDNTPGYIPLAQQAVPKAYDQTWKAHRIVKFNSEKLEWRLPVSAAERAEGKKAPQEILPTPDHQFVAVRGIPLGFHYGFSLTEGSGTDFKVHCTTTRVDELLGQNSRTIEDRHPLEFPLGRVNQKRTEPHTPNRWFANNPHVKLYGSRGPVGQPADAPFALPRLCEDCVKAGEHYIGSEEAFKDPKQQIPSCRMSGYLLFAVFELGIQDPTDLMEDPINGTVKVKWRSVAEAKLHTEVNGQRVPLDRPFILKIEGLGSSQQSSIGKGEYDWKVETQADSNTSILPAGKKLLSAGDFFNYINDRNFTGIRNRKLKGGNIAYPVVTEVYTGKLAVAKMNSTYIPVFLPVTDPEVIAANEDWKPQDWLLAALAALQYERSLVSPNGAVAAPALPTPVATAALPAKTTPAKATKAKTPESYLAEQGFEVFGKPPTAN